MTAATRTTRFREAVPEPLGALQARDAERFAVTLGDDTFKFVYDQNTPLR